MMHVEHLTKMFGHKAVVCDMSFTLASNQMTALVGPSGAGKTTALLMLAGQVTPTAGTIQLDEPMPMQQQIGFSPQQPTFLEWMTVLEYMIVMGKLAGFTETEAIERADEVLRFVRLYDVCRQTIAKCSSSVRQRLSIAQAILHRPKILLVDEPLFALDQLGRKEVMTLLRRISTTMTVMYATSTLHAELTTEHMLWIKAGRIVERGRVHEIEQKYDAPHIAITFVEEAHALQFASQSTLRVTVHGRVATVYVKNKQPTMDAITAHLAKSPFAVEKIEHAKMSLQHIFKKRMQEGDPL